MSCTPSVAVVIATFNAERTIANAIESVLLQDYKNLELVVIDGGSSDGTVELVKRFEGIRIKIVSEPDYGIYDAWNKGVGLTSAERILFIGADDTLNSSSSISEFWRYVEIDMLPNPILYGGLIALGNKGTQVGRVGGPWRNPWTFWGRHIWSSFPIPIMATFFSREAIISAGLFDSSLKIMADIDLVLDISKKSTPIYIPQITITNMGFGGISTRPDAGALAMKEASAVRCRHNLGVYTNVEFVLRQVQHNAKYLVYKYLGKKAAGVMINFIHFIKKSIILKR